MLNRLRSAVRQHSTGGHRQVLTVVPTVPRSNAFASVPALTVANPLLLGRTQCNRVVIVMSPHRVRQSDCVRSIYAVTLARVRVKTVQICVTAPLATNVSRKLKVRSEAATSISARFGDARPPLPEKSRLSKFAVVAVTPKVPAESSRYDRSGIRRDRHRSAVRQRSTRGHRQVLTPPTVPRSNASASGQGPRSCCLPLLLRLTVRREVIARVRQSDCLRSLPRSRSSSSPRQRLCVLPLRSRHQSAKSNPKPLPSLLR